MNFLNEFRPCKRHPGPEIEEHKRLVQENTQLAQKASETALQTSRKIEKNNIVLFLTSVNEIQKLFVDRDA